jgi:uncharacterized protein (DUF305 family)
VPAEAAPSDADVTFTQNMIPHHEQAIEMAKLVDSHTDRPELHKLADSIVTSQSREITQMEAWLRSWGKACNATGRARRPRRHRDARHDERGPI